MPLSVDELVYVNRFREIVNWGFVRSTAVYVHYELFAHDDESVTGCIYHLRSDTTRLFI